MENYNEIKKYDWGTFYYLDDELHRLDGPAKEYANGDKYWFQNGLLHRIGGPAKEYSNGRKEWWFEGKRHRADGSAIEYADGTNFWYYEGEKIYCNSQKEFERLIRLKMLW